MTGLESYTLVAVDGPRWFGLRQRHQHLMEGLSHYFGRTLYFESSASVARVLLKRDFPISELWEYRNPPEQLGEKLWRIKTPPGLPQALGTERVNRYNKRRITKKIMQHLGTGEKVVLWVGGPKAGDMIDLLDIKLIIYDCYDAFSTFAWEARHASYIDKLERHLLSESDIILTTSIGLMEKAGKEDPRVHLVRNACDFNHFASIRQPPPDFKPVIDLSSFGKPLMGYMGDIAEWLDHDMVKFLAESRPQWTFVFLGPPKVDISMLTALPNVHFTGIVPYGELPYYIHHFDCLLIPFVLNDLTKEVNPVKMYEYLATGIPVVSTAMPEVVRHEEVVNIGRSPEDFLAKIEKAISEGNEELVAKRQEVARTNSWADRVESVARIISEAIETGNE